MFDITMLYVSVISRKNKDVLLLKVCLYFLLFYGPPAHLRITVIHACKVPRCMRVDMFMLFLPGTQ